MLAGTRRDRNKKSRLQRRFSNRPLKTGAPDTRIRPLAETPINVEELELLPGRLIPAACTTVILTGSEAWRPSRLPTEFHRLCPLRTQITCGYELGHRRAVAWPELILIYRRPSIVDRPRVKAFPQFLNLFVDAVR
jgi:hypothetical protein